MKIIFFFIAIKINEWKWAQITEYVSAHKVRIPINMKTISSNSTFLS